MAWQWPIRGQTMARRWPNSVRELSQRCPNCAPATSGLWSSRGREFRGAVSEQFLGGVPSSANKRLLKPRHVRETSSLLVTLPPVLNSSAREQSAALFCPGPQFIPRPCRQRFFPNLGRYYFYSSQMKAHRNASFPSLLTIVPWPSTMRSKSHRRIPRLSREKRSGP